MAIKRYDPAVKVAFSKAAQDARKAGKTWAEAFAAAKEAGYKGSAGGLQQLLYVKPAARRGRKPGQKAGLKTRGWDVPFPLSNVEAAIDAIVKERVRARLDSIIAQLKAAM